MTRLAAAGNPFFEVLDLETVKPEKSYTVDTLETLQNMYSGSSLYFLLGVDAFLDIPNWWRPGRLISLARFVVLSRPGGRFGELISSPYVSEEEELLNSLDRGEQKAVTIKLGKSGEAVLLNITSMDVSSRDIRRRLKEGLSVKYLLPEAVESYIISKKLYINEK
jgi:nicotinate-nucleotide adenylyltransferase